MQWKIHSFSFNEKTGLKGGKHFTFIPQFIWGNVRLDSILLCWDDSNVFIMVLINHCSHH